jgi:hypothetical protein
MSGIILSLLAKTIINEKKDKTEFFPQRGLESPAVKALDNDYVKLARDIVLPSEAEEDGDVDLR